MIVDRLNVEGRDEEREKGRRKYIMTLKKGLRYGHVNNTTYWRSKSE